MVIQMPGPFGEIRSMSMRAEFGLSVRREFPVIAVYNRPAPTVAGDAGSWPRLWPERNDNFQYHSQIEHGSQGRGNGAWLKSRPRRIRSQGLNVSA